MAEYLHNENCITPVMTANNAPSPVVVSASNEGSGNEVYRAFDHNGAGEPWYYGGTDAPQFFKVDLGSGNARQISSYTLTSNGNNTTYPGMSTAWMTKGSNVDDIDTAITLDTRSAEWSWDDAEMRTYELAATSAAYRYFWLYMTAKEAGDYGWQIAEFELIYDAPLPGDLPTVTTQSVTSKTSSGCVGNGTITDIGGSNVTVRGFCYRAGTTGTPDIDNDFEVHDTGVFEAGSYFKSITGLSLVSTSYRVRAYATNSQGTSYGATVEVTPLESIDRMARYRPAFGGISCGHPDVTAGTIGSLVWDLGKTKKYILSNNHVLADCNRAQIGDPIYQPGVYDGGTVADTLAHLTQFKEIDFSGAHNYADCAIAEVDDPSQITTAIADLVDHVGAVNRNVAIGDPVKKSGRTTGVTTGTVVYFSGAISINYGNNLVAVFDDLIITYGMLAGGDSGSLLLSAEDDRPVGLMFAGNASEQLDASCRIGYVIDALPILFEGDEPYRLLTCSYAIEEYQKALTCKYNILEFALQISGLYNMGASPYPIYTLRQLQKMYGGTYEVPNVFEVQNDIDATPTLEWNWDETLGVYRGFDPIDTDNLTLHAGYHMISNLYINRSDEDNVGLFGSCAYLTLEKVVLNNIDITGKGAVGGLLGSGLRWWNIISKCIASGSIVGASGVGGLIGGISGDATAKLEKSQFTGTVTGDAFVGGLIGSSNISINDCYCQGVAEAVDNLAGLIGNVSGGYIVRCLSAVYVKLSPGNNYNYGAIYASNTPIDMPLVSSFWDSDVCSEITVDDYARTTVQLQNRDTFPDWDFDIVWSIIQFQDYPRLRFGIYWAEALERLGFADRVVGINMMSRLHEYLDIIDVYQIINLRDKLPDSIAFRDVVHNYLKYHVANKEGIGFADFMRINTQSQRFLTPSFGLRDAIQCLNWTQFLKVNKQYLVERYFCYLSAPGFDTIELPVSSFQGRRRKDYVSYLSVVVPDDSYYPQILERSTGELSIYMGYELFGAIYLRQIILQVDLDGIFYYRGANEQSIQLDGRRAYASSPKTVRIDNSSYKSIINGLVRIRCAIPDLFLSPGDTVITEDENFECGEISYTVSVIQSSMEVTEVEAA